jgi:UDP-glucose 4-epimerase
MTEMGSHRVAVIGGTGFIGRTVVSSLRDRGHQVTSVPAPRLSTAARSVEALEHAAGESAHVDELREGLRGHDVVINAAGCSEATAAAGDGLFGANALLPVVIYQAASRSAVDRYIHISSAAVQGRRPVLDETASWAPFSPYSHSKALAERALIRRPRVCLFRPTSVHGVDRAVTRSLARLARSPLGSVAGEGTRPTPQVLVDDVGEAITWLVAASEPLPAVVLQPWSGMTTAGLLQALARRSPRHVPMPVARATLRALRLVGMLRPEARGVARRVEMLWLGQAQAPGWLDGSGYQPMSRPSAWLALGDECRVALEVPT